MSDALRLSVSKAKTYTDCNKKYYFSYILKLPKKERDYHIFGKFIHKVLEDFHSDLINGVKDKSHEVMAKVYKNALLEYKSKMTTDALKEAYQMVDSYLKKFASEVNDKTKILSVEKNFNIKLSDNVSLNGMIDRVQLDSDGIVHICDYKTVKNKKYLKNDFLQLLTYAFVIYNEDPTIEKVRGSYILLRHDFEYMTTEFSKDEILGIKDKYEDYAKSIEEEKLWRANPTRLCDYCDFLPSCEEGLNFSNKIKNVKHGKVSW